MAILTKEDIPELGENVNYKDLKLQTVNSIILDKKFYEYFDTLSFRTKINF